MSARMLQRALRNNHAEPPPFDNVSPDVDGSDSDRGDGRGSVSNPFDLLGLQDEEENEDADVERDSHQQNAAGSASTSSTVSVLPRKSKRKKNKSGKKGKKEPSLDEGPVVGDDDESVDHLLERLAVGSGEGSSSISYGSHSNNGNAHVESRGSLAVELKHLSAEGELRRIFGSKVIKSVERRGDGVRALRRQVGGSRRTGRVMPWRKSVLVVPMEHWARCDGGITMECYRVEGRLQYFRYQYSASYKDVQKRFESCVASHDPNTILLLLRSHPYHVDSLLALAEVYKQMGEHQQSANLIEQCLYVLECAWHPWFNPTLGTCRLEFSWDANKALFLALFRHMQHLGRRGCHRTALEVCKLLLSLDPNDPLGALFCIDYFALRAEQYKWLEYFVEDYETGISTLRFPNFCFSVAVAALYLERQQYENNSLSNDCQKRGKDSAGSESSSSIRLQKALTLHPSVLKKLIVKASIKEDRSWEKIMSHYYFNQTLVGGSTLEHLVDIYVERNYVIWRSAELQDWLKEAAAAVTQIADRSLHSTSDSEMVKWDRVRNELFPSDKNEYSHLHVSEYSDSTSVLPPEDMAQFNFHPHEGGFAAEEDMLRAAGLPSEGGHLQQAGHQENFPGRNALLVFLQSLVPRMDYGDEPSVEDTPTLLGDDSNEND